MTIKLKPSRGQSSLTRVTVTSVIWWVGSGGVADEAKRGEVWVPEDVGIEVAGGSVTLRDQTQQLPRSLCHFFVVDLHPCLRDGEVEEGEGRELRR